MLSLQICVHALDVLLGRLSVDLNLAELLLGSKLLVLVMVPGADLLLWKCLKLRGDLCVLISELVEFDQPSVPLSVHAPSATPRVIPAARARVARPGPLHHPAALAAGRPEVQAL